MKCYHCKADIDIYRPPFGAYICQKKHVRCAACAFISITCPKCATEAKYKSKHFAALQFKSSYALEFPPSRTTTSTEEDDDNFRRARRSFLDQEFDEAKCFRGCNEVNSVRTLSAMIVKDLYSEGDVNGRNEAEKKYEYRFHRIMRALRESGYSSPPDDNNSGEDVLMKSFQLQTTSQLEILFPQGSQLRASAIKLTSSTSHVSQITLKTEKEDDVDPIVSDGDDSENSSLNWADYQSVSCMNLIDHPPLGFPVLIPEMSLDRHPFYCPISSCVGKIFISDFNQHILHDHPNLPLTTLKFGQFKEVFIDVKIHTWSPFTIGCFFMTNIVKNFSTPPFQDSLPMILMIGRYQLREDCEPINIKIGSAVADASWSKLDCLIIWLMGVVPEQCDILVGISIFSKTDSQLSRWLVDHLNPIQNSAKIEDIFKSSRRLVLTYREIQMLTNNFEEPLTCQIGLVNYDLK